MLSFKFTDFERQTKITCPLSVCGWRQLRKLISDFSIFMSIMTFVGLDMLMGLKTPKLIVPTEFKVLLTAANSVRK